MEILLSKPIGFCSGVKQAVALAHECLRIAEEQNLPAYSIGNFIHNKKVVASFEELGLRHIDKPSEGEKGVALIRAHGISDKLRREFLEAGFQLVDGTCRNVKRSQEQIRQVPVGTTVVIAGIANHSETIALAGVEREPSNQIATYIIEEASEVETLPLHEGPWFLVVQTTLKESKYRAILAAMQERYGEALFVGNNLCREPLSRNREVLRLLSQVDAMVVVGGKHSANTQTLVDLITQHQKRVFHVEDASDVTAEMRTFTRLGVVSGASTPLEEIEKVVNCLQQGNSVNP